MGYKKDGATSVSHLVGAFAAGWGAETTFDLSGSPVVGAAQKLVILKISLDQYNAVVFRPLGDALDYHPSSVQKAFGIAVVSPKVGDHAIAITYTDTSGRVGAVCCNTPSFNPVTANVTVLGACDLDMLGTPEVILSAAGAPSSWSTNYTVAALGGVEGLCVVRVTPTATNVLQVVAFRPSDVATDNYKNYLGSMRAATIQSGETALFLVSTDPTGRFQMRGYNPSYPLDVDVVATVPGWERNRSTVYGPVDPAVSSTFYDMATIGVDDSLALYQANMTAGTARILAFREKGDAGIYVDGASSYIYAMGAAIARPYVGMCSYGWAPTNLGDAQVASQYNGSTIRIDSIGFVGLGNEAPVVTESTPADLSVVDRIGQSISWITTDDVGVDPASHDLEVTTLSGTSDAVIGSVAQAGWSFESVANASNGYDCTATPDNMERGAWSVTATCDDLLGSSGSDTWGWDAVNVPVVISMYPSGVVPSIDQIRFQIEDDAAFGLIPATLSISAIVSSGGQNTLWPAVVLGVVQDGWDITVTYPGATPTLMDITIREWPFDLDGTYRRAEIVVDIDSTSGFSL